MKKLDTNVDLPQSVNGDKKDLIVLCESINPAKITEKDIDTFSVALGPNNEITNNDATDNMINANILSTISVSDTMLKGSITHPAVTEKNANKLIGYNSYIQKSCLESIFNNFMDQALNNLYIKVKEVMDENIDNQLISYLDIFMPFYGRKYRIISDLFSAYNCSTTVEEFNVVAVQIATLSSNALTLDVRNDIYNLMCKYICVHTCAINTLMTSLENDIMLFHDTVVDILFHITGLITDYYGNVRSYNNYSISKYDF